MVLNQSENNILFKCNHCGACCSNLSYFHGMYDDLNRGDGICKYFDEKTKLCTIYQLRPIKCRVEDGYNVFHTLIGKEVSYSTYIEDTKKACSYLKTIDKN